MGSSGPAGGTYVSDPALLLQMHARLWGTLIWSLPSTGLRSQLVLPYATVTIRRSEVP